MRRATTWLFLLVAVLALAGLVLLSGGAPVDARVGHLPPTRWLLTLSKRSAIEVRTLGVDVPPDLEDERRVRRGAAAFDTGCRPCHGSPLDDVPTELRYMTPEPPSLVGSAARWDPKELFWIIKHGLKFTGMPGWPARDRDDEVWDMVGFVLRIPAMDGASYRQVALGPLADAPAESPAVRTTLANCLRCHGEEGEGVAGAFPALAGQPAAYLEGALAAYGAGTRPSGIMEPVAAALSPATRRDLAAHFARLAARAPQPAEADSAVLRRGEELARRGAPERKIPACTPCHGPNRGSPVPVYPRLAGQHADYLARQLRLFREGTRGGDAYAHVMTAAARELSDPDIRALALWYSRFGGPGP